MSTEPHPNSGSDGRSRDEAYEVLDIGAHPRRRWIVAPFAALARAVPGIASSRTERPR